MSIEGDIVVEPVVDEGTPSSNPTNPILNPEPEVKDEAPDTPEKPEPKVDPIPKGVQKRIDRAVREKYEAQARTKMLEERLAALEQQTRQPQQVQRTSDNSEPRIDNFENFDEYVAAKARWIAKQELETTLSEREKRQAAERETAARQQLADSWSKKIAQATADLPDFEDVLSSSDVPMTDAMHHAIMESDIGPKLAYHLASNPEEAYKIAQMPPMRAIAALGRLEERLETQKPVVKPTSAPPPIKAVGGQAKVSKDPGKMTDAEYAKWRQSGKS